MSAGVAQCFACQKASSAPAPVASTLRQPVLSPHVLDVLTLRGSQITEVSAFVDREMLTDFGLPKER